MENIGLALLWIGGLSALYFGLYLLNKKTPKPEGCENLEVACEGCNQIDCTNHKAHQTSKEEQ